MTTTKTSIYCECGALALHINEKPVVELVCHCSDCRHFSGLPYTELAFFKPEACSVDGQTHMTVIKGDSGFDKTHYSCLSCQTALYVKIAALNGATAIVANRLSSFTFKPQAHIWTSKKLNSVTIPTGMIQSLGRPPKEIAKIMVSMFWDKK
jgi:hypothetical protein|tara:strand:- start:410 stop:865 length:456 start_codon:yes stop_codon:yes gene_type:complete